MFQPGTIASMVTATTLFLAILGRAPTCWGADEGDMLTARPEVVQAWQDMRFGMFLCWGPVTLTGKEIGWSRGAPRGGELRVLQGQGETPVDVYDNLYKQWKPDHFDARDWVRVAQDAGCRYLIFLVKHHDGFCLYDTQLTDYRSTGPESAWKVDVLRAVADACHEADLKLILYYSQPDWHHPDYRTRNHHRYISYLHGQVRELLTNYGRIDGFWFDLGGKPEDWNTAELFRMMRTLQPWLIINNRCGVPGDFDTPEQYIGHFQSDRPWESCCTLGTQWSWKPDDTLKSTAECIQMLVGCAVGNGNLALNTNPMPDGRIEPRQADRFREIGQWLGKYGESIHGTRGGPFLARGIGRAWRTQDGLALPQGSWWGGSTHKDHVAYLHILRWPSDTIQLSDIGCGIVDHRVLTGGEAEVHQTEDGIEVRVPEHQRDAIDTIIELRFDRSLSDVEPVGGPSLLATWPGGSVSASGEWPAPKLDAASAFDGDFHTRWGGAPNTTAGWLAVDFGQSVTVAQAMIDEAGWDRVRRFELQYMSEGEWQTILAGTTLGAEKQLEFAPVTAQQFRLNILEATDVPTIWEFQLLPLSK